MPRVRHPETGKFVENWMLDEPRSDGCPPEKRFLPLLPPPWKSRWCRKRYVDARRPICRGVKPVRICRRLEDIRQAVEEMEREIQQHGRLALGLSTGQRYVAAQIFAIAERLGVDALDVMREFEKTHPHGENARTLDQVRVEVVAAKRKMVRSERHILSLDYRLRTLVKAIGDKPVTAITTQDLQQELERHPDWNPTTIHSVVQGWKIALNFAIHRGYLVNNPATKLELPRIVREEPVVLSILEARTLLAATLFSDRDPLMPECRAYLAIGMFAGLRPMKEMPHLDWSDINLDAGTITVRAANAKARVRRIVTIEPNLVAWLRPLQRTRGRVLRHSLEDLRLAARRVLGLPRWPADVLRHTFASYYFELYHDEARTKKQIGHRDDGRVFYDHYCKPVYPAEAAAFWKIFPPVDVLPCYAPGWAEAHPAVRLALALAA
jgi:integrase